MIYCRKCGAELPDCAKFCGECGEEVDAKVNKTGLTIGIILLVIGLTTLMGPLGTIIGLLIAVVAIMVKKVNR